MKQKSGVHAWITLIGVVLVLLGVYASTRTAINFVAFSKYPTDGILTFFVSGVGYSPREEDCNFPGVYFTPDGLKERPATDEEKEREQTQQESCLSSVSEARNKAKINDISQSLLFLFLGSGILIARRIFGF